MHPSRKRPASAHPFPAQRHLRCTVLAVHGALAVMSAARAADDPALEALTRRDNVVELGVRTADGFSAKANEYSGWTGKGSRLFGNFDLNGGGAYDGSDRSRWHLGGERLGSRSASLQGEYGIQGSFRVRFGADELRRNQSDDFQTPYQGMGGHVLTLPSTWVVPVVPRVSATAPNARGLSPAVSASDAVVGGLLVAPTAAQLTTSSSLQAADLAAFHTVGLYTQRERRHIGLDQEIGAGWSWKAEVGREDTRGLKTQPGQSRLVGGDTSSILVAPIDQSQDTASVAFSFTGDGLQLQLGWEESVFTNHVPSITWSLWASPQSSATQATAPSNRYSKATLSGSVAIGQATTLTGQLSGSRARQNDSLLSDSTALLVPLASAQALVAGQAASLKLLHKATPRLHLGAALRHVTQEDRTPVNTYGFYDNDNPAAGSSPFAYLFPQLTGLGSNFNLNANTPYSRRSNEVEFDASYRYGNGRQARLAWLTQKTERHCVGSWINCADAPRSSEHTLRGEWSGRLNDETSARLALSAARRRVDYDENAFLAVVPMAGRTPSTATGALAGSTAASALQTLGLTGYGPMSGLNPSAPATTLLGFYFPANNVLSNTLYGNQNRISELPGLRRWNQADRDRGTARVSMQWTPDERWSLQTAAEAGEDHYARSVYGLQRSGRRALHMDLGYQRLDRYGFNAFASYEVQALRFAGNTYTANSTATSVNGATRVDGGCFATIALRNASNKIDPCLDWSASSHDRTATVGVTGTLYKLLAGRLDLNASLVRSDGHGSTDVAGGNYVNNPFAGIAGAASSTLAASYIPATALPNTLARSTEVHLGGVWRLSDRQTLRAAYAWQQLHSEDWRYEALQDGGLTQVLPTRELAPRHVLNSLALSLAVAF